MLGPRRHFDVFGRRFVHRGASADLGVVDQIFRHRDYDFSPLLRGGEIARFYSDSARPLIVDVGANIGASAVWFATEYPKAKIVAIEPHPGNFALLKRNVAGLDVRTVQGALALTAGPVQLLDPGEGEWTYRTSKTGEIASGGDMGEVQGFTIDHLVDGDEEPFVLKIDIKGAETGLFDGELGKVASTFPMLVIELHDWNAAALPGAVSVA